MAPFDSLRDYAEALEKRGKFVKVKEMDQDKYEATAFHYKILDRWKTNAPGFLIEKTKVNKTWHTVPVVGNLFNGFDTVAECFGVDKISDSQSEMNTAASEKITSYLVNDRWKSIDPVIVDKRKLPARKWSSAAMMWTSINFPGYATTLMTAASTSAPDAALWKTRSWAEMWAPTACRSRGRARPA